MSVYQARRLPANQGPAAWNEILTKQAAPEILEGNETADFVIIGAGFAGLSAARRILQLQPNAGVCVMEAGRIAEGATGRNSGFMIDLPHNLASEDYSGAGDDRMMIALNRQAIAFGKEAVEEYGIDQNYFDQAGKVNGAASEAANNHNLTYARHLNSLGETSSMLDRKQMQELTGSLHYHSGLYTPGTVMLQPAGYIRGLANGLKRKARIFGNSPATKFKKQGNNWIVTSPKGNISTGKIILANNGHLESFGFKRGQLMQLFLYASMTPELDDDALEKLGGESRWGVTPSDPMGTTMRRIDTAQGGNRIITRTCATLRPNMNPSASDVRRAAQVQQRKFDQRFPQLAGMKMQYEWAGHLCLSLNGVSVMRELDDNVFSACVQNGLGTTRGASTGMGAAELACGVTSNITEYFKVEAEPKRLPPQPFQQWGANTWLRYKEFRASDE